MILTYDLSINFIIDKPFIKNFSIRFLSKKIWHNSLTSSMRCFFNFKIFSFYVWFNIQVIIFQNALNKSLPTLIFSFIFFQIQTYTSERGFDVLWPSNLGHHCTPEDWCEVWIRTKIVRKFQFIFKGNTCQPFQCGSIMDGSVFG